MRRDRIYRLAWILAVAAIGLLGQTAMVHATNLYWDTNGTATSGCGTIAGTWGIDSFWNTSSTGSGGTLTAITAATDALEFIAGSSTTYNGTVTVDSSLGNPQYCYSLKAQDIGSSSAHLVLTGGTISFGGTGIGEINVNSSKYLDVRSQIDASATPNGLTKTGAGNLYLYNTANIYTGTGGASTGLTFSGGTTYLYGANAVYHGTTSFTTANTSSVRFDSGALGDGPIVVSGTGAATIYWNTGNTEDITASGRLTINNGCSLDVRPSTTTTFAGSIGGTGGTLSIDASATLNLNAANPNLSSVVWGMGNLNIGHSDGSGGTGALGSGPFTINAGGVSGVFDNKTGSTLTLSNSVYFNGYAGGGSLAPAAFGLTNPLVLNGPVTLTRGGNEGTGNYSSQGVNVTGADLTIAGNIAPTAGYITSNYGFTKQGIGKLIITGTCSYTGTTVISAGTLQVGNGGATGDLGSAPITDNASLVFNRNNSLTVSSAISGSGGSVTQYGSGTTILTGGNSYGATTVSHGTLQIGNGGASGTLGSGTVTLSDVASSLVFSRNDIVTVGNTITGSGSVTQNGSGTTILTGSNSYDATTVSAGTLQIGNGAAAGTLGTGAVGISSGAFLRFNRSDSVTIANAISGDGGVIQQNATGTTILTGGNSYGETRILAGTLQVGNGTASGTLGTGDVTDNGSLVFNRSNSLTVDNYIGGTGTVTQSGAGTTILTHTNFYVSTIVQAGTLEAMTPASMPGYDDPAKLTVASGATVAVSSSGWLAPDIDPLVGNSNFNAGNVGFDVAAGSFSYGTAITHTIGLVKFGGGTLVLGGANTYNGLTNVIAGTLALGLDDAIPSGAGKGNVAVNTGADARSGRP